MLSYETMHVIYMIKNADVPLPSIEHSRETFILDELLIKSYLKIYFLYYYYLIYVCLKY